MLLKYATHQAKKCMRVSELRCPAPLPGKECLIGIALGWWSVALKQGDVKALARQRKAGEQPANTCSYYRNGFCTR